MVEGVTSSNVNPLSEERRGQVRRHTDATVARVAGLLDIELEPVPVLFDLRGRSAGMYRVRNQQRVIRYNPWIFARYFSDNMADTVPHEVAHYAVERMYGTGKTRPHGEEWRSVMQLLGVEPGTTCAYDITGLPQREYRRFAYQCACRRHELTSIRHRRVKRGVRYYCRSCRHMLTAVKP